MTSVIYELENKEIYILKCKEKDLTHNMREMYKHKTVLPIATSTNIFSNGEYFYIAFIQGEKHMDLHGEILKRSGE